MKRLSALCVIGFGALLAAGCASNQPKPEANAGLPDWVMNPTIEGGIAATECVPASDQFSLDKAEASATARATLVKQINVRVKAMDKTYQRRTRADGATNSGSTFESVSGQVADEHISGSQALKVDYVAINDKKNLCVLMALNPQRSKELFNEILQQSKRSLDPESKDALYEEFRAAKAQQELNDATKR